MIPLRNLGLRPRVCQRTRRKRWLHIYQGLKTVLCSGLLKLAPKLGGLALSEYSTKNATRSFDIAASAPSNIAFHCPIYH